LINGDKQYSVVLPKIQVIWFIGHWISYAKEYFQDDPSVQNPVGKTFMASTSWISPDFYKIIDYLWSIHNYFRMVMILLLPRFHHAPNKLLQPKITSSFSLWSTLCDSHDLCECEGNVAHYWPYAIIKSRGVSIILISSTLILISIRIEIATFK